MQQAEPQITQGSSRFDDPYGFDPAFHEQARPFVRFLFDSYWRVGVDGARHLPKAGPAILVGNHSGALPFDAMMLGYAVAQKGRIIRPLFHRFVDRHPLASRTARRLGGVPATYDTADDLLARGELVTIFPEGVDGVGKLFEQRYEVGRFATSAARLSMEHRVPIVPFSIVGAEEIYPLVGRSEEVGRRIGAPWLPMTPLFPLLGPLGALPLPTKWSLRFGPRIHLYREARFTGSDDFEGMSERLRRTVQLQLTRQAGERESVFFG